MTYRAAVARTLGAKIRAYRKAQNLTQADLALRAKVGKTQVAHTETAQDVPTGRVLRAMAEGLELTGRETIEVLTIGTMARHRRVISVVDLDGKDVEKVVRLVERLRRKIGLTAACDKCNAGPHETCAPQCTTGGKGARHE